MDQAIPDVFDDLEIGITVHDPETGAIVGVNERLEELYGYTSGQLQNMDIADYSAGEFTQEQAERRIRAAAEGDPQTFEWHVERASGETVWVRVRLAATTLDGEEYVVAEIRDITERKEREQALERKNRVLDAAPVGISITDPNEADNPMVYVNDRYVEITGYSRAEAIGRNCRVLQGNDTDDQPVREMREAIDAARPVTVELRNYTKSGEEFWNRVSIAPVRDNDGELVNFVGFQQDVTDSREREKRLESSNERLQRFAYVLSHDLQEPLRMVSSYVDLLEVELGDDLDEETQEYIDFAVDGAERMQEMIDGLLQYSRIETQGREFEPTDAEAVLDDVQRDLQFALDGADADLVVGDLPTVYADEQQLGQLFQNLIQNAVDHGSTSPDSQTPQDAIDHGGAGVTIEITATEREDTAEFAVADDGPGIPKDERDHLFDLFEKGEDSDGTGIGLAVCERIVDRHGGTIRVESTVGEGTTFVVTLPKSPA